MHTAAQKLPSQVKKTQSLQQMKHKNRINLLFLLLLLPQKSFPKEE